jgi:uncharacterized membrane protein
MLLLSFIFSQISKLVFTPRNFKLLPKAVSNKSYLLPATLTGSFLADLYLFQYYAYQAGGNLSTVNIIKGTYTVFIVFLSTVFLNDKKIVAKKIIASLLVSAALILIKVM